MKASAKCTRQQGLHYYINHRRRPGHYLLAIVRTTRALELCVFRKREHKNMCNITHSTAALVTTNDYSTQADACFVLLQLINDTGLILSCRTVQQLITTCVRTADNHSYRWKGKHGNGPVWHFVLLCLTEYQYFLLPGHLVLSHSVDEHRDSSSP